MTREQALRNAIGMLDFGMGVSPERATAMARAAMAWVAIADRLPVVETWPPKSMPADKDVQRCGHGGIAWRNAGRWVHTANMVWCDLPPQEAP